MYVWMVQVHHHRRSQLPCGLALFICIYALSRPSPTLRTSYICAKPARVNVQIPTCSAITNLMRRMDRSAYICQEVEAWCDELVKGGVRESYTILWLFGACDGRTYPLTHMVRSYSSRSPTNNYKMYSYLQPSYIHRMESLDRMCTKSCLIRVGSEES